MIKKWLRPVVSNAVALVSTSYLIQGFYVEPTPTTIAIGAVVLSLVNYFGKPILKIISFPINAVTLGFFNWVINVILLYITIQLVDGIKAEAGMFSLSFMGLVIPEVHLSTLWTLVLASILIGSINWILKKILL